MLINRKRTGVNGLSVDWSNTTTFPPNPNGVEGVDPVEITERDMTGGIDPNEDLVATQTIMADFIAGNQRIIATIFGTEIGNRIAIVIPLALYTKNDSGDREGIAIRDIMFDCVGEESGAFLCFF